jgi:hypothetical protein
VTTILPFPGPKVEPKALARIDRELAGLEAEYIRIGTILLEMDGRKKRLTAERKRLTRRKRTSK